MKIQNVLSLLLLSLWSMQVLTAQEVRFDENTYYRLTNAWMGQERSLDVNPDDKTLMMAPTGNYGGQFWKIRYQGDGWYKLSCQWLGDDKVIDVINDGKNNRMAMVDNAGYSGQMWYITPAYDGYFQLINGWQTEKALDCDSDKNGYGAYLLPIGEYSGQLWRITDMSAPDSTHAPDPAPAPVAEGKVRIGDRAHGGIVFLVDHTGEHGWVCQPNHFKQLMSFQEAKKACENSTVNGYDDWRLPHPEELLLMYHNLHMTDIATMGKTLYWTDHETDEHHMCGVNLKTAEIINHEDKDKSQVWAVRRF